MREGLREVPDEPIGLWVVLLGEETDVVAEPTESLEHLFRLVVPTQQDQVVGEPEARHEETPFATVEAVDVFVGVGLVPTDEPLGDEPLLNGIDGSDDAWVIGWQEA